MAILDLGERAVDPLVEIVTNEELWDEAAPGDGWAPIQAARLLGAIGDASAIEPLYRTLYACDPDALLDTAITHSLQEIGPPVIEPGVEFLGEFGDDFRDDLACVFAGLDVDRRIVFQVLVKNLVDNPLLGAENLVRYGDSEALDALEPMLNRLLIAGANHPARADEAIAVAEAIEQLGGDLSENQQLQLELIREQSESAEEILERIKQGRADHDHPDTHVEEHDIGRNDPCWCGSGKKYKHCHWREDRR
jgi:HEAT repeat protein